MRVAFVHLIFLTFLRGSGCECVPPSEQFVEVKTSGLARDSVLAQSLLANTSMPHLAQCASLCSRLAACLSFWYLPQLQLCLLHRDLYLPATAGRPPDERYFAADGVLSCGQPPVVANAHVTHNGTTMSDVFWATCWEDFAFFGPTPWGSCLDNGQWEPIIGACHQTVWRSVTGTLDEPLIVTPADGFVLTVIGVPRSKEMSVVLGKTGEGSSLRANFMKSANRVVYGMFDGRWSEIKRMAFPFQADQVFNLTIAVTTTQAVIFVDAQLSTTVDFRARMPYTKIKSVRVVVGNYIIHSVEFFHPNTTLVSGHYP